MVLWLEVEDNSRAVKHTSDLVWLIREVNSLISTTFRSICVLFFVLWSFFDLGGGGQEGGWVSHRTGNQNTDGNLLGYFLEVDLGHDLGS